MRNLNTIMSDISFGEEDGDFNIPDSMLASMESAHKNDPAKSAASLSGSVYEKQSRINVDGTDFIVLRPGKQIMGVKTPVTRKVCEEHHIAWSDTWIVGRRKTGYDGAAHGDPECYNEWECYFMVMTDHTPYRSLNLTCSNVISTTTNRLGGGPQEPTPNAANRTSIQLGTDTIWVPPRPDSSVSKSKRKNCHNDAMAHKKPKTVTQPRVISENELTKTFAVNTGCDMDLGDVVAHGKRLLEWNERPQPENEPSSRGEIEGAVPEDKPAAAKKNKGKPPSRALPPAEDPPTNAARTKGPFEGLSHREAMRAIRKYIGEDKQVPTRQKSMFSLLMSICDRQVTAGKPKTDPKSFVSHTLTKLSLPTGQWTEHDMVKAIKNYGNGDKQARKALLSDWNSIQAAFNELFAPEYTTGL